jgi:hypothetical protein
MEGGEGGLTRQRRVRSENGSKGECRDSHGWTRRLVQNRADKFSNLLDRDAWLKVRSLNKKTSLTISELVTDMHGDGLNAEGLSLSWARY